MKSKEIFNLAVRLLGLVFLYLAFRNLPLLIMSFSVGGLVAFACYLLIALWLISGARLLMRLAYPASSKDLEA